MGLLFRTLLNTVCFSGVIITTALAQEIELSTDSDDDSGARAIEEITVIGGQSLYRLRLVIEAKEEEVYEIFNELNGNDEFDITCAREVYIGSYIPKRDCMAAFLRKAQARNTQNYLNCIDIQLTRKSIPGEVREKAQEMEAEMTRLAQGNESFFRALQNLAELLGAYEQKKARRFSFFK